MSFTLLRTAPTPNPFPSLDTSQLSSNFTPVQNGPREIVLVRHGRPDLSRNVRLTAQGYRDWWTRYDSVGLKDGAVMPPRVRELVEGAARVASSPLPRALETARMARDWEEPDHILPDMVEAPLPPPDLGPLKFRPLTWGTISRLRWLAHHGHGSETAPQSRARAARVARELEHLTPDGRTVVFAHGWFNRTVGNALKRAGWRCAEGRGDAYWSFRRYVKD